MSSKCKTASGKSKVSMIFDPFNLSLWTRGTCGWCIPMPVFFLLALCVAVVPCSSISFRYRGGILRGAVIRLVVFFFLGSWWHPSFVPRGVILLINKGSKLFTETSLSPPTGNCAFCFQPRYHHLFFLFFSSFPDIPPVELAIDDPPSRRNTVSQWAQTDHPIQ